MYALNKVKGKGLIMKTYKFKINNLDCANCANELERSLKKIDVIKKISVNFMTQKLIFECQEENQDIVVKIVKKVLKKEDPILTIEEA